MTANSAIQLRQKSFLTEKRRASKVVYGSRRPMQRPTSDSSMTDEAQDNHITVSPQRRVAFRIDDGDEDDRIKVRGDTSILYSDVDVTPVATKKKATNGFGSSGSYERRRPSFISTDNKKAN